MSIANTLAATARKPHLTLDQRAQILNMVGSDLNAAAEVISAIAGIVSMVDPEFASAQDLAASIRSTVPALKVRAREIADDAPDAQSLVGR